jgi:tetratricopeptide (TPR) repeat protein
MTQLAFIDPLPTDVWIYVIVIGGALIFAGLFKVSVKGFEIDAGKRGRVVALVIGIICLGLGIAGKEGAISLPSPGPTDPHAQFKTGDDLLESGEDRKALKELQSAARALGDNPCSAAHAEWAPSLFADLGRAQLNTGNSEAAKQSFYTSLCLNPDNQPVHDALAKVAGNEDTLAQDYLELGNKLSKRDYAARIYTRYIGVRPNDPVGYLKRGEAFNDQGKFDDAARDFQRADQLVPQQQNPGAYQGTQAYINKDWGYTLLAQNKCEAAAQKFTRAKQLFEATHKDGGAAQQGLAEAKQCLHH